MTEKINNLKQYINENFLLTLTNKGIYNRSVKDIDNIINNSPEKIHIEEAEDKIREEILSKNNGHVVSQKITQNKNKDFGDYYEFEITKEF